MSGRFPKLVTFFTAPTSLSLASDASVDTASIAAPPVGAILVDKTKIDLTSSGSIVSTDFSIKIGSIPNAPAIRLDTPASSRALRLPATIANRFQPHENLSPRLIRWHDTYFSQLTNSKEF